MLILLLALMTINGIEPALSHGNEPVSEYEGPTIVIPYVDGVATIDGQVTVDEYPEPGHLELSGFSEELKFKHNGTHLMVGIELDVARMAGIGLHPVSTHDEENAGSEYIFFLSPVASNDTVEKRVVVSDQDMETIEGQVSGVDLFIASQGVSGEARVLEMAIPLDRSIELNSTDATSGEHVETPSVGSIFHAVIIYSEDSNPQSAEDMTFSSLIPMYLARPGEDLDQLTRLFAKEPNWIQALVIPSLLVVLMIFTVYQYLPRRRSEDELQEGGK